MGIWVFSAGHMGNISNEAAEGTAWQELVSQKPNTISGDEFQQWPVLKALFLDLKNALILNCCE